jgi:hypothetical protein
LCCSTVSAHRSLLTSGGRLSQWHAPTPGSPSDASYMCVPRAVPRCCMLLLPSPDATNTSRRQNNSNIVLAKQSPPPRNTGAAHPSVDCCTSMNWRQLNCRCQHGHCAAVDDSGLTCTQAHQDNRQAVWTPRACTHDSRAGQTYSRASHGTRLLRTAAQLPTASNTHARAKACGKEHDDGKPRQQCLLRTTANGHRP